MFGTVHFSLFVLSVLALNATPGPDTAFIVARSLRDGRAAGVVSALGISAGCCVHLTATVPGLTALLAASAHAFLVIKMAGAAYLIYLGVRMLLVRAAPAGPVAPGAVDVPSVEVPAARRSLRRIFAQGLLTNLLNPKVVLFFVAFFPQFVAPSAVSKSVALLALGVVFVAMSTIWNTALACLAGTISRRLTNGVRMRRLIDRLVGGVFIALGVRLMTISR